MRGALLVTVALVLAGCAGGGDAPGEPQASATQSGTGLPRLNNTTAPPLPVTLELGGCLQFHTFFPFPVSVFEQLGFTKPEGFEYQSADGQTVQVLLAWWFCPTGALNNTPNMPFADVGSMFAAIPVVPPSSLTASDTNPVPVQVDLLPLVWVINNQIAADHLGLIEGLRDGYVEMGDVQPTANAQLGVAAAQGAFAAASFGIFSVDLAYQAASGGNEQGRYRMWLAPEQRVTGYLDIVNGAGTALGSGEATMRFQGDLEAGAPPAWPGTSHVVDATDVTVGHVSLVAADA